MRTPPVPHDPNPNLQRLTLSILAALLGVGTVVAVCMAFRLDQLPPDSVPRPRNPKAAAGGWATLALVLGVSTLLVGRFGLGRSRRHRSRRRQPLSPTATDRFLPPHRPRVRPNRGASSDRTWTLVAHPEGGTFVLQLERPWFAARASCVNDRIRLETVPLAEERLGSELSAAAARVFADHLAATSSDGHAAEALRESEPELVELDPVPAELREWLWDKSQLARAQGAWRGAAPD
ncbi:MAG: hypothetical protein FJ387_03950 [Verrucomicrobia bacterium]|nr:hypothetical protein [Verrucomicrobiota bacterium]